MKEAVARQSVTGKDRSPLSTEVEVMATRTETSPCPAQRAKAESRQREDWLFGFFSFNLDFISHDQVLLDFMSSFFP